MADTDTGTDTNTGGPHPQRPRPRRRPPPQKQKPARTGVDIVLMSFAALVVLGTLFGVIYIVSSHQASQSAYDKANMRPLKYQTRTAMVKASGGDIVWAYHSSGLYILLTQDDLAGDVAREPLLQAVIAPFSGNRHALPGSKLYTASGLEGLHVIDLEKAGRLNTAEIITRLCTELDPQSHVCSGYASQRVEKLRKRLNRVLHHAFFRHLSDGNAGAMSFHSGRASFYQHYTPLPAEPDDAVKVGRHRISQVKCNGCFEG